MTVRRLAAWVAIGLLVLPPPAGASSSERELGRRFMLEARSQLPLVEDPAVVELVRTLGAKLVAGLGPQEFDYHFYVVEQPSLNAFAVPGGYVFFFSGLVARVDDEDELVGVMAHEIAHVHAHHVERQQTAGQVWTAAALLGVLASLINPVLGAAGIAAAQTAQLKYSREFEQEADFLGLRIATEAGYDPHALAAFFGELLAEQRLNPVRVPPYMLSHPVTQERIAKVESVIASEKLVTPPGRPATSLALRDAQAVVRGMGESRDAVVAEYERGVDAHPKDPIAIFLLGRVYQSIGKMDAARVALEKSRALGGADGRELRALGAVYLATDRPADAAKMLETYLRQHPRDAWSHLTLGKALAASGDGEGAGVEYRRALALDGDYGDAHRALGLYLGKRGEEGDGFYHLALDARDRGDLVQGYAYFQRAADLLPKGDPRQHEIEGALDELKPLVRDQLAPANARGRRPPGLQGPPGLQPPGASQRPAASPPPAVLPPPSVLQRSTGPRPLGVP